LALYYCKYGITFIFANEFFDSLPINQYIFKNGKWFERLIGIKKNKLSFLFNDSSENYLITVNEIKKYNEFINGDIYESSPSTLEIITTIKNHLKYYLGYALILDYGYFNGTGDTLQSVKSHKYFDLLKMPGSVDITSHVNFQKIKLNLIDKRINFYEIINQGDFLIKLGIFVMVERLKNKINSDSHKAINLVLDRLVYEMGEIFKVLLFSSKKLLTPEGFKNFIE